MEATALLTLPLILFFSLATNGVSARHGISIVDKPPAVLDIYGNSLRKGEYYHLRPLIFLRPLGGVITIGENNNTCLPQLLVETLIDIKNPCAGDPVKFSTVETDEEEVIRESTDLYVEFRDRLSPTCGGSLLGAQGINLTVGGAQQDKSNWFKIEKAPEILDGFYKLVSTQYGRDIGTPGPTHIRGTQPLILADNPLGFVFGKEICIISF